MLGRGTNSGGFFADAFGGHPDELSSRDVDGAEADEEDGLDHYFCWSGVCVFVEETAT